MRLSIFTAGAALLLIAGAGANAQTVADNGPNTITGRTAPPAGQTPCGSGMVYLYDSFPDISGADGGVRIPKFEQPTADTPHREAACADGGFTFKNLPDGTYIVGLPPKDAAGLVLDDLTSVEGGKTVTITLKPEGVGRY